MMIVVKKLVLQEQVLPAIISYTFPRKFGVYQTSGWEASSANRFLLKKRV